MNPQGPIRLLLFQASDLHRAALCAAFQGQRGIAVVGVFDDELEVMREAGRRMVDVALLDADLGRSRVLSVCRAMKAMGPGSVLVIDDSGDEAFFLELMGAGADGYLDRSTSLSQLVSAVRRLHAGEPWVTPNLLRTTLRRLVDPGRAGRRPATDPPRLSRRQREVAGLLAEGMNNLAIAERLAISPHTVRSHVQKVREKLDANSRIEAAAIALDLQSVDVSHAF